MVVITEGPDGTCEGSVTVDGITQTMDGLPFDYMLKWARATLSEATLSSRYKRFW